MFRSRSATRRRSRPTTGLGSRRGTSARARARRAMIGTTPGSSDRSRLLSFPRHSVARGRHAFVPRERRRAGSRGTSRADRRVRTCIGGRLGEAPLASGRRSARSTKLRGRWRRLETRSVSRRPRLRAGRPSRCNPTGPRE
jgi:hypothetical protein